MANQYIKPISNRLYLITPDDHGQILELGPGGNNQWTGTFILQFSPDSRWNGSLIVMAKVSGQAGLDANIPFVPVPYRRVSLNNAASDYAITADTLVLPLGGKIQVPASGDSIGLLVACTTGSCYVVSNQVNGGSSV